MYIYIITYMAVSILYMALFHVLLMVAPVVVLWAPISHTLLRLRHVRVHTAGNGGSGGSPTTAQKPKSPGTQ